MCRVNKPELHMQPVRDTCLSADCYLARSLPAISLPLSTTSHPRALFRAHRYPCRVANSSAQGSQRRHKTWLTRFRAGGDASPFDRMSTPENRPGFLSNLSPWASRSVTPKPPPTPRNPEEDREKDKGKEREAAASGLGSQRGGDHIVDRRHRLSLKRYPQDCPALAVRWFHAVDVSSFNNMSFELVLPQR